MTLSLLLPIDFESIDMNKVKTAESVDFQDSEASIKNFQIPFQKVARDFSYTLGKQNPKLSSHWKKDNFAFGIRHFAKLKFSKIFVTDQRRESAKFLWQKNCCHFAPRLYFLKFSSGLSLLVAPKPIPNAKNFKNSKRKTKNGNTVGNRMSVGEPNPNCPRRPIGRPGANVNL